MIHLNQDMMIWFKTKVKILWNNWPTGVIDNLIPTIPLPGCISGIFPRLQVCVSYNFKRTQTDTQSFINFYILWAKCTASITKLGTRSFNRIHQTHQSVELMERRGFYPISGEPCINFQSGRKILLLPPGSADESQWHAPCITAQ